MLEVKNLYTGYGGFELLQNLTFTLQPGTVTLLTGTSGAGRSTVAKAIMAMLPWRGYMAWQGKSLYGLPTYQVVRLGLAYIPQNRQVFTGLYVEQNLLLGQYESNRDRYESLELTYQKFPQLAKRRYTPAQKLSGGEQQLLMLARCLQGFPECLILDEISEGMAPETLKQVSLILQELQQKGVTIFLLEQKNSFLTELADHLLLLSNGKLNPMRSYQ
jgi:branched-chain amino acid transport system ATP-binding protein